MSDYWNTFRQNARESVSSRMPQRWSLASFEASAGVVRADFTWAGDHSMTMEVRAPNENEALLELLTHLDALASQTR